MTPAQKKKLKQLEIELWGRCMDHKVSHMEALAGGDTK